MDFIKKNWKYILGGMLILAAFFVGLALAGPGWAIGAAGAAGGSFAAGLGKLKFPISPGRSGVDSDASQRISSGIGKLEEDTGRLQAAVRDAHDAIDRSYEAERNLERNNINLAGVLAKRDERYEAAKRRNYEPDPGEGH